MAAEYPGHAWPRIVVNPQAGLVTQYERAELVAELRILAALVEELPDPFVIEDPLHLDVLRRLYVFFDNGTWNTPEVEAWCVVKHYASPGWPPNVWSGHRTQEDAETFAGLLREHYAAKYPRGGPVDTWEVERRMCRVVDLRDAPGRAR